MPADVAGTTVSHNRTCDCFLVIGDGRQNLGRYHVPAFQVVATGGHKGTSSAGHGQSLHRLAMVKRVHTFLYEGGKARRVSAVHMWGGWVYVPRAYHVRWLECPTA